MHYTRAGGHAANQRCWLGVLCGKNWCYVAKWPHQIFHRLGVRAFKALSLLRYLMEVTFNLWSKHARAQFDELTRDFVLLDVAAESLCLVAENFSRERLLTSLAKFFCEVSF